MAKKSKNPLQSAFRKTVKNIMSRMEKATQRGFSFRDISSMLKEPKVIRQETINKLRKFKGEKLYHYATYYDTEGNKYTGEKGRKKELSFWGREGAKQRNINLKRMNFEREEREKQEQFIREHNMTDREKEIYLNEGEDAYYEFIHEFDFIDDVADTVLDEPEKPEAPKIPNHKGEYEKYDTYDMDYNDAILLRVEEMLDGWTPQSWWFDAQIAIKEWRRGKVQNELYDAINTLELRNEKTGELIKDGRQIVAENCEDAGYNLLDKLWKVLYESESAKNQADIEYAQEYCITVFWGTSRTVLTAKSLSEELEESWID